QVLRNDVSDGGAIAVCATLLFLLVVVRMAQLLRRVEERTLELDERNQALRRVLDTVNEGLLRVSPDGTLMIERSAIVDRWFRSFDQPLPLAEFMKEFDQGFADAFRLGHAALLEDALPVELCLAQLPSRLRSKNQEFRVSYLEVVEGTKSEGLL